MLVSTFYPKITIDEPFAAPLGAHLEQCSPLEWPGAANVNEEFVKQLITRLVNASYREPELLGLFAFSSTAVSKLLRHASWILSNEPNVVDVVVPEQASCHVFGDIHGDLHSLLNALNQAQLPSPDNLLVFAGDYVDRGPWGIEVLLIVLALKIWRPTCVFLLRGNHETLDCVHRYGFAEEVRYKYSPKLLTSFTNMFRQFPLAAVIRTVPAFSTSEQDETKTTQKRKAKAKKRSSFRPASKQFPQVEYAWAAPCLPGEKRVAVLHGGLFRSEFSRKEGRMEVATLPQLMDVSRREDSPHASMVEDVIWSDPQLEGNGISENYLRGCGILFGKTTLDYFLKNNNLHGLIRAHEGPDMREQRSDMPSVEDGYSIDMEVSSGFLVTIFSAADYPPQKPRGNRGAFVTLQGRADEQIQMMMPKFTTFTRLHPPSDAMLFDGAERGASCTPRSSFSSD